MFNLLLKNNNKNNKILFNNIYKNKFSSNECLYSINENTINNYNFNYDTHEVIFLGPDEQIIPDDINWIITRANQRKYPLANAFMSSKPKTGINHKEYGVTSEGVSVFLDVALKSLKLHPTIQDKGYFTCKISGGPDGDVAGNLIKILNREYGEKGCKILGIADGTGSLEDENGIDMKSLLDLVNNNLPIIQFPKSKISNKGVLNDALTSEGARLRNTMHNRIITDCFITGGGRPSTISNSNWKNFCDDNLKPSSPLIVEGANLFLTPKAREELSKKSNVTVVKDSSANKCGVICSSYEILSSMLLTEDEYINVKDQFVIEVIERLRNLAKYEAELLFKEQNNKTNKEYPLPEVSTNVSNKINILQDNFTDYLKLDKNQDYLLNIIFDKNLKTNESLFIKKHLPKTLTNDIYWKRFNEKLPSNYLAQLGKLYIIYYFITTYTILYN